jgi:hypothetical protein
MEIRKQKFRQIACMLRKDDEQPSKVLLQWNPHGRRRPKNRWRKSTLKEVGVS